MAKFNDIRALAEETVGKVSRSPQEWMGYLDTAARLYRYPFSDSLLIHAQRPDAIACASMELWNGKMHRWVKRGAKGIALIDDHGRKKRLKYVFDISDTRLVRGGRTPFLWQIGEGQREAVKDYLSEIYWLEGECTSSLPAILKEIASGLADEELEEAIEGLKQEADGAFQGMEPEDIREKFRNLLSNSLFYVLSRRCGLEPTEYLGKDAFTGITDFGSLPLLSFLGDATNKLAEPVLISIRKEMQKFYLKEKQAEKETKKEAKEKEKEKNTTEGERPKWIEGGEKENEADLLPERGLPVPGSDHQGGRGRNREIRNVEGNISEGTSEGMVSEPASLREVEPASGRNRENRQGEVGNHNGRAVREPSSPRQESRPNGMDRPYERIDSDGGGNYSDRIDLSLGEKPDNQETTIKNELDKAEEQPASALLLPDLPGVEEQKRTIEKQMAALYEGKLSIPTEVIDEFLRDGGNHRGSRERIISIFMRDKEPEEYCCYLFFLTNDYSDCLSQN